MDTFDFVPYCHAGDTCPMKYPIMHITNVFFCPMGYCLTTRLLISITSTIRRPSFAFFRKLSTGTSVLLLPGREWGCQAGSGAARQGVGLPGREWGCQAGSGAARQGVGLAARPVGG